MSSRIGRIVRRILLGAVSLVALLLVTGAAWEQWSRSQLPKLMPATSRLVDVGDGRRLHLDCRGTGQPTVLFESPLGMHGALFWSALQDSLAPVTRSCAYSRAGHVWSDPTPAEYSADRMVSDLTAALAAAGESGPFVLVGFRAGVPLAFRFAAANPQLVTAAVMANGFHPDHFARLAPHLPGYDQPRSNPMASAMASLSRVGIARLAVSGAFENPLIAATAPTSLAGALREGELLDDMLALPAAARSFGDRPLVVLVPTRTTRAASEMQQQFQIGPEAVVAADAEYLRMQEELASWSTRGRLEVNPTPTPEPYEAAPGYILAPILALLQELRAGDT